MLQIEWKDTNLADREGLPELESAKDEAQREALVYLRKEAVKVTLRAETRKDRIRLHALWEYLNIECAAVQHTARPASESGQIEHLSFIFPKDCSLSMD